MSKVKSWSFSPWALYTLCPFKYKCEKIDKLPQPQSPAFKRGNEVHVALAQYVDGKAETLPADVMKHGRVMQVIQEVRAFPDKLVEQQWGFKRDWTETSWFGGDTYFRAVLDVALLYEDMTGEAVDWKTGKKYGSNADQMELFALTMMWKYKPIRNVTTRLVYIDSGEEDIAEYPVTDRDKLTAKWEKAIVPMFNDVVFAPRPNDKCKFCHFSRSNQGPCKFG